MRRVVIWFIAITTIMANMVFKINGAEDGVKVNIPKLKNAILSPSISGSFATSPIILVLAQRENIGDYPGSAISEYIASDLSLKIVKYYQSSPKISERKGELGNALMEQINNSHKFYLSKIEDAVASLNSNDSINIQENEKDMLKKPANIIGVRIFTTLNGKNLIEGVQTSDSFVIVLAKKYSNVNERKIELCHYAPTFFKSKSIRSENTTDDFFVTEISKGNLVIVASSQFKNQIFSILSYVLLILSFQSTKIKI
jgi:hypothetical protein